MNNIISKTLIKARSNINSSLQTLKSLLKSREQLIKEEIGKIEDDDAKDILYSMIELSRQMRESYKMHDFEINESHTDVKNKDEHAVKAEEQHNIFHIKSREFHELERTLIDKYNIPINQIHKIVYSTKKRSF